MKVLELNQKEGSTGLFSSVSNGNSISIITLILLVDISHLKSKAQSRRSNLRIKCKPWYKLKIYTVSCPKEVKIWYKSFDLLAQKQLINFIMFRKTNQTSCVEAFYENTYHPTEHFDHLLHDETTIAYNISKSNTITLYRGK